MISAFELYWILKLDALAKAFSVAVIICFVAFLLLLLASFVSFIAKLDSSAQCAASYTTRRERILYRGKFSLFRTYSKRFFKMSLVSLSLFIVFVVLFVLTPSSKQMAAIMVIPKIATAENVEALTSEAKSLYELAKEYFRESVTDKEAIHE